MKAAFAVILLVTSYIALATAQESATPAEAPACGSPDVHFEMKLSPPQPAAQPEEGKALIYVVKDQRYSFAKNITSRIGLDGSWVGAARGPSYVSIAAEPGEHHLCVDWVSEWLPEGRLISLYGLTVEPGKTYFFRARIDYTGVLDLDLVNADEGKHLVASSQLSTSHPKK